MCITKLCTAITSENHNPYPRWPLWRVIHKNRKAQAQLKNQCDTLDMSYAKPWISNSRVACAGTGAGFLLSRSHATLWALCSAKLIKIAGFLCVMTLPTYTLLSFERATLRHHAAA